MLWFYASAVILLLNSAFCFPRGKVTEKPEIPSVSNPMSPKQRRPPTHISEFTDPDTGLNPFLDLEEGRTSEGRNVMEDERSDDAPFFDIDLVEGDAPDRRWGFDEPKEHLGRVPIRWPTTDYKDDPDVSVTITPLILPNPPTTVELFITEVIQNVKSEPDQREEEIRHKKEEKESVEVSQSTVIYASATIAAVATIILLVGACWWRRKLKTLQSPTTAENGETKR